MAYTAVTRSVKATYKLNAGTDIQTGKTTYKNLSISGLRSNPDAAKIAALAPLFDAVLLYPVAGMSTTEVKDLENV